MELNPIIKRSKRRTLAIVINRRGEIIVHAPIKYPDSKIFAFIDDKRQWIEKKVAEAKATYDELTLSEGETISILGEEYSIRLIERARVRIDGQQIVLPTQDTKNKLVSYLKRVAKDYLTKRVAELAEMHGFKYQSIKITSATSRWGSCSGSNALNFTYKLVLCPKSVVDYIIIHELTHTIIKNHSKRFYNHIAKIMPNYKVAEQWLKVNRYIIEMI